MKKKCYRCQNVKERREFGVNASRYDGLQHACKECKRELSRLYNLNNRSKLRERLKKYRIQNPEKNSECNRRSIEKASKLHKIIVRTYGAFCVCCREDDITCLEIDHIHNDGYLVRKKGGGHTLYRLIIKSGFPRDRFQVLCRNCNTAKRKLKGVMPEYRRDKYSKKERESNA